MYHPAPLQYLSRVRWNDSHNRRSLLPHQCVVPVGDLLIKDKTRQEENGFPLHLPQTLWKLPPSTKFPSGIVFLQILQRSIPLAPSRVGFWRSHPSARIPLVRFLTHAWESADYHTRQDKTGTHTAASHSTGVTGGQVPHFPLVFLCLVVKAQEHRLRNGELFHVAYLTDPSMICQFITPKLSNLILTWGCTTGCKYLKLSAMILTLNMAWHNKRCLSVWLLMDACNVWGTGIPSILFHQ